MWLSNARKSDFIARAAGVRRTHSCGSSSSASLCGTLPSGVSVFTVWDGGSRPAPLGNTAPTRALDDDPHEWVRRTPAARAMKSAFLSVDSRIVDTCGGYCDTYNYPFSTATAALSPLSP
jgi:hypothetical protein